jgi:hypothetical protein
VTRAWNSIVAGPVDYFGIAGFVLVVLAIAVLLGAAWHYFPHWLPRLAWLDGLRRLHRPHWPRWRRKRRAGAEAIDDAPVEAIESEVLPDLPVAEFRTRADIFAAEGRFAEAVRERLRAIVRALVDARVIDAHPEWTVTELARAAATREPALDATLSGAGQVFSDIWYGERPARYEHDQQMRSYEERVTEIVGTVGAPR